MENVKHTRVTQVEQNIFSVAVEPVWQWIKFRNPNILWQILNVYFHLSRQTKNTKPHANGWPMTITGHPTIHTHTHPCGFIFPCKNVCILAVNHFIASSTSAHRATSTTNSEHRQTYSYSIHFGLSEHTTVYSVTVQGQTSSDINEDLQTKNHSFNTILTVSKA